MDEEVAEVAESVEAPAAEAPAAVSEAPASEAAAPEAPVTVAEAPAADPVTSDNFGWDGWEGNTDAFPEDIRPWADGISKYHQASLDTHTANYTSLKELYDAVLLGEEDPRLGTMATERDALITERDKYKADFEGAQASMQQYQQAVQLHYVQKAEAALDRFVDSRPDILAKPEKYELFSELLTEKWDLESAGKLLDMPKEAADIARKAHKDGVPTAYAIRLALAKVPPQVQNPQPRPGATITSGATSGRVSPNSAARGMGDAKSLEESRSMATRRALKVHKS